MRLFLGISGAGLDDQVLDDMCVKYAVTHPHLTQDRHMTLCFLGEYSYAQQQQLVLALDEKVETEPLCAIYWHGERISAFPHEEPNAWAWQGALTPSLDRCIKQLCELPMLKAQLCFQHFIPHVTLTYISTAGQSYPNVELERDIHFTQLILYCSIAESERMAMPSRGSGAKPRYKKLRVWEI